MSTGGPPKKIKDKLVTQIDDFGRKKFTLQAQDEDENNQAQENVNYSILENGRHRSALIGRDQKIDTNRYIGRIQTTKKNKKTEVFYCDVCKLGFKCDIAYITHINSPAHNRKIGMNMKVLAVSTESVAEKLRKLKDDKTNKMSKKQAKIHKILEKEIKKQRQDENQYQEQNKGPIQNQSEQQSQQKCIKQQQQVKDEIKQENQQKIQNQQVDPDEELMRQCLGFTSFGSKKKKY